jgi:hypothetical protein
MEEFRVGKWEGWKGKTRQDKESAKPEEKKR